MYDCILKNGTIVKGDGSEPFKGDVAIKDGKIAKVSSHIDSQCQEVLDISGKYISPGFIDIHSHSDLTLIANSLGESKLYQGVTTEVVGNCGLTAFPLSDEQRRKSLAFIDVPNLEWEWKNTDEYLHVQSKYITAINRVPLVGYGSIRAKVMGYSESVANEEQIKAIAEELESCFKAGIWGLSIGLGYAPDFYSNEDELVEAAKVVKKYDRVFSFHVRGERDTLFKAIQEVINIARRSGANVEISHLKCAHISNIGRMNEILKMITDARQDGLNINFDQYPYTAGNSYLGLVFPPYAHRDGMDGLMDILGSKEQREILKHDMLHGINTWCSMLNLGQADNLIVSNIPEQFNQYLGKSISDIASSMGVDVAEAACCLMEKCNGKVEMLIHQQRESDLKLAMANPLGSFGSDGFAMDKGEIIQKGRPHPRSFGTFPRVIKKYVREEGVLTLENAISKMTWKNASKIRLFDRGLIEEGFVADLVVFDIDKIEDTATYDNPFSYAKGIEHVIVSGEFEIKDGQMTGLLQGKQLLRSDYGN